MNIFTPFADAAIEVWKQINKQNYKEIFISNADIVKKRRARVLRLANQAHRDGDFYNETRALFIIRTIDSRHWKIIEKNDNPSTNENIKKHPTGKNLELIPSSVNSYQQESRAK